MATNRSFPSAYTPYEYEAARPLCGLCGNETRKRAVFFDSRQKRPLCARCAVMCKLRRDLESAKHRERLAKELGEKGLGYKPG